MKKWLFATVATSTLLLAGCAETSVEDVTKDEKSSASDKKEKDDSNKVYGVGDTVKINGVKITIENAEFTPPAEYGAPEKDEVLTLALKVVNTNKESAFIDSTDFKLYDKNGEQFDSYFSYDEMEISADLNAGKNKSGKLYYDVTKESAYELIYQPAFSWDDKEVKWKIKVN